MLFAEGKRASLRLVGAAALLVAGEAAGFGLARRGGAGLWGWAVFCVATGGLAAYGWGVRRLGWGLLFALGAVLALRTEAALNAVLDGNAGLGGARPALLLPVEGDVARRAQTKRGAGRVEFSSHAGPLPLKVVLPIPDGGHLPRVGETWRVDGFIARTGEAAARYRRRTLWVPEERGARCAVEGAVDGARARWAALGEELARRVGAGLGWCPELAGLNRAILLGRRGGLSRERRQVFADAGTLHVFAISGLHVMVVAWLLQTALARLDVPSPLRGFVCVPLVWGYVVLTGARPSAVRAALMATLLLLAPAFGRRPDPCAAWAVTALAVYGHAPERLFDLGCALSFAVMFGIVVWCDGARCFEPWFEAGSRWRRWTGDLGVSCAAWAAGVPIMAHAFGRFTPGGLLANMAVLVCAKWMVRLGAGGLVASCVCLPLAALANNLAAACTWAMMWVSARVAALPFANFTVTPWPLSLCALWYLGCLFMGVLALRFLPRKGMPARRWW